MAPTSLSAAQARRIALAAQGFADPPHARPTMRTLERTVARTGLLQVDSVNVLQRAHLMPLYSRMGPYPPALLERATGGAPRTRRLVEYWAHMQALMPVELWPAMRPRMASYRARRGKWWQDLDHDLVRRVLAEVGERGACTARDLDDGGPRRRDNWGWNWSATRKALDFLYLCGDLVLTGRTPSFEARYDLPERALPAEVLAAPALTETEADRVLLARAARSCGVATVRCLADYHRMPVKRAAAAVATLAEEGLLEPVRVQGWDRPAYLHAEARLPRRIEARALLSPFDPVVWERSRTEALFGFRYRIEIYVPRERRVHGYYVLPFLLGDRLVARVDLKADRAARTLRVPAAYAEPDAPAETAAELGAQLWQLAGWLGLDEVRVEPRGDLAGRLAAVLAGA